MSGIAAWDLNETLQYWATHPGKTLLVLFTGQGTQAVQRYLESMLPGVRMQFIPDPLKLDGDLAFAHVEAMPPELVSALAASRCHGLRAEFTVVERASGAEAFTVAGAAPIIDAGVIPGELRNRLSRMESQAARVTARYSGDVILVADGEYRFTVQVYPGSGQLFIDGKLQPGGERPIRLSAGRHQLELRATFDPDPLSMVARLYWQSPGSGGERELVPFYRISAVDPGCVASLPAAAVQ
jgi:hypothetical protein